MEEKPPHPNPTPRFLKLRRGSSCPRVHIHPGDTRPQEVVYRPESKRLPKQVPARSHMCGTLARSPFSLTQLQEKKGEATKISACHLPQQSWHALPGNQ